MKSIAIIKSMGSKVAIDDYGVGYSSLERVKILQPNIVKFDRSWLLRAHEAKKYEDDFSNSADEIKQLGIDVLIEGVEFDYDLKMVDLINPDYVQGYWYGKPQKTLQILTIKKLFFNNHQTYPCVRFCDYYVF